jgi:hypothetical protein
MAGNAYVAVGALNQPVVVMLRFDFQNRSVGKILQVKTIIPCQLLRREIGLPIQI